MITQYSGIISWLVLGIIAGSLVHVLFPSSAKGGILSAWLTGILGAVVGGLIARIFLNISIQGITTEGIVVATISALILTVIQRLLFKEEKYIRTQPTKIK